MTTRTPNLSLLALPVLALALACPGGTGKTTTDTTASSTGATTSGATDSTATDPTTTGGSSTGSGTSGASTGGSSTTGSTTGATTGTTTGATTGSTGGSSGSSTGAPACQGQGESCAGVGEQCCPGLECCAGVPVPPGQEFCGDTCPISDRNLKTDLAEVDAAQVLARVVELPISTWRYRKDGAEVRHLGPMAQDFRAAFGLWNTDTMIFPLDASGVSFAAIQALHARLVAAEAENERLSARLERLERALERR